MVKTAIVLWICLLIICVSCTDITEYSETYSAGVNIYSPGNLAHLGSFPAPPSAKSILIRGKYIYFTSTSGSFSRGNLDTGELEEEVVIGSASTAAYGDIVNNPERNSVYVIGPIGNVIEISVPDCSVVDEFSVCAAPTQFSVTKGLHPYLWVVDGLENRICQVAIESNGYAGDIGFPESRIITDIEASQYNDSLLVGTSAGCFRITALGPGNFRNQIVSDFNWYIQSLSAIPGDSNFVAVASSEGSARIGELWVYSDSAFTFPPSHFFNTEGIQGYSFISKPAEDPDYTYVLASELDINSTLRTYKNGYEYGIVNFVEVPGNPLDLDVAENGDIYVLTYQ